MEFLLCVIDIYIYMYSKYAWIIPLKNKKGITKVLQVLQKVMTTPIASQTKYR